MTARSRSRRHYLVGARVRLEIRRCACIKVTRLLPGGAADQRGFSPKRPFARISVRLDLASFLRDPAGWTESTSRRPKPSNYRDLDFLPHFEMREYRHSETPGARGRASAPGFRAGSPFPGRLLGNAAARNGVPERGSSPEWLSDSISMNLFIYKSAEVLQNGQNRSSTRRFCPISRISIFCCISRCGNMDVSGLAAQPIPASGNLGHSFQHNPRFCECTGSNARSPAVSCRLPTEVFHRQQLSRT